MDRTNPGFGAPMNQEPPVAAKEVEEQVLHAGSPFSFAEGMRADCIKIIHDVILSDLNPETKYNMIAVLLRENQDFSMKFVTWRNNQRSLFIPDDVMGLLQSNQQRQIAFWMHHGHFDQAVQLAFRASIAAGYGMRDYVQFVNDPNRFTTFIFDNAKRMLEEWMAKKHAEKRKVGMRGMGEMEAKRPRAEEVAQVEVMHTPMQQNIVVSAPPGFQHTSGLSPAPPLGLFHNYGYQSPLQPRWESFGGLNANSRSYSPLGHVSNMQNRETVSARYGSQLEPQTQSKADENAMGLVKKDNGTSSVMESTYEHDFGRGLRQNREYGTPPDMETTYEHDFGHTQKSNTYGLHETPTRPESSFSSSTTAPVAVTTTAKCTISTYKNEALAKSDDELTKPYERPYLEQSQDNREKFDGEVTATQFEEKPWNLDAPTEKSREYSEPTLAVKPSAPSRSRSNSRARQASASRKPRSSSRNLKPSLPVPKKRSESPVSEPVPPASLVRKRSKSSSNRPLTSTSAPRKRSESPKFKATRQPKRNALNILLLGETGVGKTTFINGLANYLKFETLDGALNEEPTILIDTSFTITGMDNKTRTISAKANTGVDKKTIKLNERLGQNGTSSTQDPVDHTFEWMDDGEKKLVRLIDTPGINDTRGTEQDAKNFEKILKHIAELEELHAICIVMKPNESKFTVGFRYCLDELLVKLHKSATKNILFCFTNTRSTLYRPGDSIATLLEYLENLYRETGIRIDARRSNIFCYDNESFRYLCLLRQIRTARKDDMITTYAESWTHNVKESIMMLKRVQGLTAHVVEDTLTINNARKVVTALARPLAEMARNQVVNMNVIQDQMKEVENLQRTGQSLDERLFQDQVVMVPVKLEKPRTVCTSLSCVDTVNINGYENQIFPKIICHDACYLTGVPEQSLNNQGLAHCTAFVGGNGTCRECGCHWNKHMHITYQLEKRMEKLMDKEASRKLELCSSEWKKAQIVLKELKEKLAHLKHEHDVIRESCAEFAVFLAVNALKKACDPFADYLTFLVQNECEMWSPEASNGDLITTLLDIQEDYQKRVDFIKTEIEAGRRCALSTAELNKKIINLGQLKESGPVISKLMEEHLHTCSTVEASAPPEESVKDTKKNGDRLSLMMKGMNIASDDKEKAKNDSRSASTDPQKTQRGKKKNP